VSDCTVDNLDARVDAGPGWTDSTNRHRPEYRKKKPRRTEACGANLPEREEETSVKNIKRVIENTVCLEKSNIY
jgi:hypothetical protein